MAKTLEQFTFSELEEREALLLEKISKPNTETLSPSGLELREQQLIQRLKNLGVDVPQEVPFPIFDEKPSDVLQRDEGVIKLAQMSELAGADPSDISLDYLRLKADIKARFGTAEPIGFIETFANTRVQEKIFLIGSLYKFDRLASVFEAARNLTLSPDTKVWDILTPEMHFVPSTKFIPKVQAQQRRKHDLALMEAWLIELEEKQARGISIGGRIAEGITELPKFMIEFLLTGPLFKIGSTAAKTAATKLLGRFAEKSSSKLAIKVAAAGFGSLVRTAVNIPGIFAGAAERMTEGIQVTDDGAIVFADADINPFRALARSFTDLYIENLSEITGPSIRKGVFAIGTGIGKKFPIIQKFTQTLSEKWIANRVGRTMTDFLKASATKVGYDGILEEMGEERVGAILRAITGLGSFNEIIPTWEDMLVEAGVFAVPGGVSLATTKLFRKDRPVEPIEKRLGLMTAEEFKTGLKAVQELEPVRVPEKQIAGKFVSITELSVSAQAILRPEQDEPVTPESLQRNPTIWIQLFEADKNVKLTEQEKAAGLEFLENRISKKKVFEKDRIRINANMPDDFKNFVEKVENILAVPLAAEVVTEGKVVKTTVETKTNAIKANVKEASVEAVGTIDAIRRNVLRAEDALGFWGSAGRKVQRDLREISARTAKNVGNTSQNIRRILKGLNAKEKIVVSQLTDSAISKKGQPQRLIARAQMLKEQLDIMQNEAISVGLRKAELTGKAFPQVANKKGKTLLEEGEREGLSSHRVFAWAQNQVKTGKFKTVDSAVAALQNYRRTRLRGTEGYFEGKRTFEFELDEREWSPDVILSGIIEGGWEAIEGARQWGVTKDGNFKNIRTSIERIRGEVGVDQANLLEDYIKAQYGQSKASIAAKKWNEKARAVQFVGKLALSPLTITRNMLDRYAKGLTHGTIGTNIRATIKFPPFLNKFMKTSQKIQDEMIRRGAVLGHGHLSEGFASGGAISRFIGQPFALSERGNQTYIAIIKKLQLEADIKRLNEMGGENGTVGKMYNRMLTIVGQSQQQIRNRLLTNLTNEQLADALTKKEISDDVMSEVLHRVVTDSAFPLTLASKRMWWGNRPFIQTATQFKIWTSDQMRFIYKDVWKYTAATGDPSRMFRFILGTWLAGELYNIARDFLTDKDESLLSTLKDPDGRNVKEISKSVANALVDGGIVGMLADLTYGITDWAFGPTVGSIESIARVAIAVKNDPATTVDGLKKFLLEDVPAAKQVQGILDRIDRTFWEDDNLTEKYAEWRKRSFDFRKKKGELTLIERTTGRAILGRPARLPGPRTLSLEMIARQVLVGDADDAADYIVGIIKDTKPEKLKDLRASFRQSAINNSPLGNMKKEDIPEFLNQFSKEGQAEIKALQKQWVKNYNEAFALASKQLRENKFFEELKKELME